jgi:hypothetical protein
MMSIDLEKLFSPDVLNALDERMRQIALEMQGAPAADEWLTVKQVAGLTNLSQGHIREMARCMFAEGSEDVYQPNGPGTQPLRIRRARLRDLTKKGGKK